MNFSSGTTASSANCATTASRDHGKYGVEAQFFQNEEFRYSRRLDTRALAEHWAKEMRSDIERDGLPPDEPA